MTEGRLTARGIHRTAVLAAASVGKWPSKSWRMRYASFVSGVSRVHRSAALDICSSETVRSAYSLSPSIHEYPTPGRVSRGRKVNVSERAARERVRMTHHPRIAPFGARGSHRGGRAVAIDTCASSVFESENENARRLPRH